MYSCVLARACVCGCVLHFIMKIVYSSFACKIFAGMALYRVMRNFDIVELRGLLYFVILSNHLILSKPPTRSEKNMPRPAMKIKNVPN